MSHKCPESDHEVWTEGRIFPPSEIQEGEDVMCQQQEIRAGMHSFGSQPVCREKKCFPGEDTEPDENPDVRTNEPTNTSSEAGINKHRNQLRILLKCRFHLRWFGVEPESLLLTGFQVIPILQVFVGTIYFVGSNANAGVKAGI